jgi:hypothetical protein
MSKKSKASQLSTYQFSWGIRDTPQELKELGKFD